MKFVEVVMNPQRSHGRALFADRKNQTLQINYKVLYNLHLKSHILTRHEFQHLGRPQLLECFLSHTQLRLQLKSLLISLPRILLHLLLLIAFPQQTPTSLILRTQLHWLGQIGQHRVNSAVIAASVVLAHCYLQLLLPGGFFCWWWWMTKHQGWESL